MIAPAHTVDATTYQPKGGMCCSCTRKFYDCSRLAFETMPVVARINPSTLAVRCLQYLKKES